MSAVEDGEKPEGGTMPTEALDEIEANLRQLLTGLLFDSQKQRAIRAALEAAVAQEREALREFLATQPSSVICDRLRSWLDARESKR